MQHPRQHDAHANSLVDEHGDKNAQSHLELTKTMSRHIASQLQVLMILSIRLWYLMYEHADDDSAKSGVKSDQVDVNTETSSEHGRQEHNSRNSTSSDSDADDQSMHSIADNEEQAEVSYLSEANVDWSAVPLCDEKPMEDDEFLQGVARSRAEHDSRLVKDRNIIEENRNRPSTGESPTVFDEFLEGLPSSLRREFEQQEAWEISRRNNTNNRGFPPHTRRSPSPSVHKSAICTEIGALGRWFGGRDQTQFVGCRRCHTQH
jgi:hypothetical protein